MSSYNFNNVDIHGNNPTFGDVKELNINLNKTLDYEKMLDDIQMIHEKVASMKTKNTEILSTLNDLKNAIILKDESKAIRIIKESGLLLRDFSISAGASYLISLL